MPTLLPDASLSQFQHFMREVYGLPNDRHFGPGEMSVQVQRFAMRGLKGIRKGNAEKTRRNLLISLSWLTSVLNRMHVDLEEEVWRRFPYLCSYCASCPCTCKKEKLEHRREVPLDNAKRPRTISGFQQMFMEIYPPGTRTLEHAGVHFAEEVGEFSEALASYRGSRSGEDFNEVRLEAADYFSCVAGVFNSLGLDLGMELSRFYPNNCPECSQAPCVCTYDYIRKIRT